MNDQTKRKEHWIKTLQDDVTVELRRSESFDESVAPGSTELDIMLNIDSLIEQYITNIWTELDGDEPVQPGRYDIPDDWREGKP